MLEYLHLKNVGPAPEMELKLAPRLNLLTGDNGLGKSFLLDIAWWALTRHWPYEVNRRLITGRMATPRQSGAATIKFRIRRRGSDYTKRIAGRTGRNRDEYQGELSRRDQGWVGPPNRPSGEAIVLYALVDGSFAVWDPARNYWKTNGSADQQDRPPAYVFSPNEVWDGYPMEPGARLCNGLISDWAGWEKEGGEAFQYLSRVLKALSSSNDESLEPGDLKRISLDDVRDIPSLRMPYGLDVPVLHASAGMRRIIALAYLLVWCWQEHLRASELLDQEPTKQIVFLIDEIEAHLHPRWQRVIARAVLNAAGELSNEMDIQVVTATHSPLVMASLEPWFDEERDAWFDLDFTSENGTPHVELNRRPFLSIGDAGNWLTSEAFDLKGAGSEEREEVLEKTARELADPGFNKIRATALKKELLAVLPDTDEFWINWNVVGKAKGWLP